jgi:hypothetical protein
MVRPIATALLFAASLLAASTAPSPAWTVFIAYNVSAAVDGRLLDPGLADGDEQLRHGWLFTSCVAGFWLVSAANRGRGLFRYNGTLEADEFFRDLFASHNITHLSSFKVVCFLFGWFVFFFFFLFFFGYKPNEWMQVTNNNVREITVEFVAGELDPNDRLWLFTLTAIDGQCKRPSDV